MYQLLIKFKRKTSGGSAGGSGVKNPPVNARDAGLSLIQEDPAAVRTASLSATATEPELWSRELQGWSLGAPGRRTEKSVRRTCREAPRAAPGEEPAAQRRSSMDKNRGVRLWGKKDLRKCFSVLSCGQRNTGRERGLLPVPTRGF